MSLKILTIDDSKTIRMIVAKAFKSFDCIVLEAEDGIAGLVVAKREKPDVVLLDYTMPLMDGFEVLARLRADPELKNIPVIMLTAEAGRETVVKIAKLGVRDYLIKPFKAEMLVERMNRVVTLNTKSESAQRRKRFDDPIRILVVDGKPAIAVQIRGALEDTPWKVTGTDQVGQGFDYCREHDVDVVLASLALPNEGAQMLLQNLRSHASTSHIPVLGMSVKTATDEQARAQQSGFQQVITKPIERGELKNKICRSLKLETEYKYFKQFDGALALTLPKDFQHEVSHTVSSRLGGFLAATVEAGGDRFIIDLSAIETASLQVVELVISSLQTCAKLSMKHIVIAPAATKALCLSYEEAKSWNFVESIDAAFPGLNERTNTP